jgi:hypothetical protein
MRLVSSALRRGSPPAVTADKSLAVYWEHVVAVTDTGCEVLDLRDGEDVTFYEHRLPPAPDARNRFLANARLLLGD